MSALGWRRRLPKLRHTQGLVVLLATLGVYQSWRIAKALDRDSLTDKAKTAAKEAAKSITDIVIDKAKEELIEAAIRRVFGS